MTPDREPTSDLPAERPRLTGGVRDVVTSPSRAGRWRLRLPGPFEWKVLAAVLIVACLPMGVTGYLLSRTLRSVSAINAQHQRQVSRSLDEALDVYRGYFAEEKETFRARAAEIAAAGVENAADLADVPELLRARILSGPRVLDAWSVHPETFAESREAPPILLALPPRSGGRPGVAAGQKPPSGTPDEARDGATEGSPRMLELTFGIDKQVYATFLSLREAIEHERELDRVLPLLMPGLSRGLAVDLAVVLVAATMIGLFVARRATKRVATLREAASRVAEGDLTVRVAPRGRDELDDLGRGFDRMVQELGEARSRLEYLQKVSAWQEVARRLAHEIKNPLTPIQLAVQELQSKYRGDDPAYQRLLATANEILKEEIGAIRRLVDDFSAFAKLPRVEPQPLDLGALVEEFPRSHPEWADALTVQRHAARVEVLADRMLIRRVLANLVENAVQAATAAGRSAAIRLSVAAGERAGLAAIHVEDNGPGIAPDIGARIFDPYFTTKESGTGLGLAIVRKIAIDHGGDVAFGKAAPPFGGARFSVYLPAADPDPVPGGGTVPPPPGGRGNR